MPNPYVSWGTPLLLKRHRVAKFKQRAILGSSPHLNSMPGMSHGACIGLVFAWLRLRMASPAEPAEERISHLAQEDTMYKVDVDCISFNRGYGGASEVQRINAAAPNLCGAHGQSNYIAEGTNALASLVQHIDDTLPGYYVVSVSFEEVDIKHAFALYADPNGMSFFDPNSGEYWVSDTGKLAFLTRLQEHYRHYVSGAGIKQALVFEELTLVQLARMGSS